VASALVVLPAGPGHRGIATAGDRAVGARIRGPASRAAVLVFLPELQCLLSADADMSRAVATGSGTTVLTATVLGQFLRSPGVWHAPLLQLEAPLHDLVQLSRGPSLVVGLGVLNLEHVRSLTGPGD